MTAGAREKKHYGGEGGSASFAPCYTLNTGVTSNMVQRMKLALPDDLARNSASLSLPVS